MSDVAVEQSGGKNSINIQNNDMSMNSLIVINQELFKLAQEYESLIDATMKV